MLMLNQLNGFSTMPPAARVSFTDSAVITTDTSTYTFTSRSLGDADNHRLIVVGIGYSHTSPPSISSVTIGGVSASLVVSAASGNGRSALWAAIVPTGTTGNVVVSLTGTPFRCAIGIWALYDLQSTTAQTATSTSDPGSLSLNIAGQGVGLGFVFGGTASGVATYTWSGLTEQFDTTAETTTSLSGAHLASETNTTPTVTVTPSLTMTFLPFVAASYR